MSQHTAFGVRVFLSRSLVSGSFYFKKQTVCSSGGHLFTWFSGKTTESDSHK